MADTLSDYKAHQPTVVLHGGPRHGEVLAEFELTGLDGYQRTQDTDLVLDEGPRGGQKKFTVHIWRWAA